MVVQIRPQDVIVISLLLKTLKTSLNTIHHVVMRLGEFWG